MPANYRSGRRGGIANVTTLRSTFLSECNDLTTAFNATVRRKPARAVGWSSWRHLPPDDKVVIEGVFLRLVSAWDSFVENTFYYYLAGGGQSLTSPPHLTNAPHSTARAAALYALRTYRTNQRASYLSWSSVTAVAGRALNEFSSNNPYAALSQSLRSHSSHNDMQNAARSIRNLIAHGTDSARASFKADVSRVTSVTITNSSRPYMVLLEDVTCPITGTVVHLFEAVSSVYQHSALIVVP
jgi:hypothetical protein